MSTTNITPTTPTAESAIDGMHCASCVAKVERELRGAAGVIDASVSLSSEDARITFSPGAVLVEQLERAVERAGTTRMWSVARSSGSCAASRRTRDAAS